MRVDGNECVYCIIWLDVGECGGPSERVGIYFFKDCKKKRLIKYYDDFDDDDNEIIHFEIDFDRLRLLLCLSILIGERDKSALVLYELLYIACSKYR